MKLFFARIVFLLPRFVATFALLGLASGCTLIPETRQREPLHNPFPQLKRIAVLPFFNQSSQPTVDTDLVAEKYYAALQAVPGFEVLPVGVAKAQWLQYSMTHGEPLTGTEFQRLAQQMGVDAIVVGSVTDYDAYYPPRMAMTVHWYAANEGFHPIPVGYGLPWGTDHEEQIPKRIAREAEFELARSQLATQTPLQIPTVMPTSGELDISGDAEINNGLPQLPGQIALTPPPPTVIDPFEDPFGDDSTQWGDPIALDHPIAADSLTSSGHPNAHGNLSVPGNQNSPGNPGSLGDPIAQGEVIEMEAPLPSQWPNPTDLIPDPPSPVRPLASVNHKPVLSHTRLYRGDDAYFTNRLSDYVETGDDARPGGWQGYLKRSDDFVHFCCHLHITEMLESRGGSEQSDLILRWQISRY